MHGIFFVCDVKGKLTVDSIIFPILALFATDSLTYPSAIAADFQSPRRFKVVILAPASAT